MGYRAEGIDQQRARIERAMNLEAREAQEAFEEWQLAKQAEKRAKSKRRGLGSLIGGAIGMAVCGPACASVGYAVGGAAGDIAYEQDWDIPIISDIMGDTMGGTHHQEMEESLVELDLLEQEAQFADVRQSIEGEYMIAEQEQEAFTDISLETLGPQMITDFLTVYGTLVGAGEVGNLAMNIKDFGMKDALKMVTDKTLNVST